MAFRGFPQVVWSAASPVLLATKTGTISNFNFKSEHGELVTNPVLDSGGTEPPEDMKAKPNDTPETKEKKKALWAEIRKKREDLVPEWAKATPQDEPSLQASKQKMIDDVLMKPRKAGAGACCVHLKGVECRVGLCEVDIHGGHVGIQIDEGFHLTSHLTAH